MKKLALPITVAAFFLAACGDTVENNTINQMGMEIVDSEGDLPKCTDENEGEQAFVKDEDATRVCVDGKWKPTAPGTSAADFSCKTVELKDKSGLKIVCNGDSIGVVLNGTDGKDGKKGDAGASGCTFSDRNDTAVVLACGDSTITIELNIGLSGDTAEADSERILTKLDSIVGLTQKGPFLKGSTVYLYELSDGRTLKQTNGNFTSNIASNDGRYKFTARDLVSQYAMVVVDGYYRNEVTGRTSDAPIRLKAITDMRKRSSVNVNILTQLEFDRVYHLVTRGDKNGNKLTVKQAKKQAQKEILRLFHIELDENIDAEDMDVFGKTAADAALLAVSVLLQGDSGSTDLSVLLTEISNAVAENGEWNDSTAKARIADWALKADSENRLEEFRKNVANWHLGDTVPDFEKNVRDFVGVVIGSGVCGGKKVPVGTFAYVTNANSAYYAQAYESVDATKNSLARLICDSKGGNHWRIATALERDTKDWADTTVGAVKKGSIDTSLTYVFEDGKWRHGTDLDFEVGVGCTQEMAAKDSVYKVSEEVWYNCVDTTISVEGVDVVSAWHIMSDFEKDMIYWESNKKADPGTLLKGEITKMTMVWDDGSLREATENEKLLKKACVTSMFGTMDSLSNTLTYTCDKSGWSKTGTFVDKRYTSSVQRTYKAVQIGNQVWMAENLNYAGTYPYTSRDNNGRLHDDSITYCYNNEYANCEKYGRLYLWSAAMDSTGVAGGTATDCGFNVTCSLDNPVRGVCPEGWHLPSKAEWDTLFAEVGETTAALKLKSTSEWYSNGNGLDTFGFSALPAGCRLGTGGYREMGEMAAFWSSTETGGYGAYYAHFYPNLDGGHLINSSKHLWYSIRCVKD